MIAARVNAERLVLLAWARAILLQLAHPLVAAGVAGHSSFRDGHFAAAVRLHHTVRAMLSLTFGTEAAREAALDGIRAIHRRVNGQLREAAGPFAAGSPYSAEDPALVRWVHLTLLESVLIVYDLLVSPLGEADRDAYCAEAAPLARALGATDVPMTWRDVHAGVVAMYDSGCITVSREARELARAVMAPPWAPLVAPAARINRLFTFGLLPPGVREQYGVAWSDRDERALARWVMILRAARRAAPDVLALWPEARHAGKSLAPPAADGRLRAPG